MKKIILFSFLILLVMLTGCQNAIVESKPQEKNEQVDIIETYQILLKDLAVENPANLDNGELMKSRIDSYFQENGIDVQGLEVNTGRTVTDGRGIVDNDQFTVTIGKDIFDGLGDPEFYSTDLRLNFIILDFYILNNGARIYYSFCDLYPSIRDGQSVYDDYEFYSPEHIFAHIEFEDGLTISKEVRNKDYLSQFRTNIGYPLSDVKKVTFHIQDTYTMYSSNGREEQVQYTSYHRYYPGTRRVWTEYWVGGSEYPDDGEGFDEFEDKSAKPVGNITSMNNSVIGGWASDPDTILPITVKLYIDNSYIGTAYTNPQDDTFSFQLGNELSEYKKYSVKIVALNSFNAPLTTTYNGQQIQYAAPAEEYFVGSQTDLSITKTLDLSSDPPTGSAEITRDYIRGAASDPDTAYPIPVQLWVDGALVQTVLTDPSTHGFEFNYSFDPFSSYSAKVVAVNCANEYVVDGLGGHAKPATGSSNKTLATGDIFSIDYLKSYIFDSENDSVANIIDFANWGEDSSWSNRIPIVLDVNGDGNDDLLMLWNDDTEDVKSMIWIASQDGSRFYGQDIVDFSNWGNNRSWSARIPTVLDVNGDGRDDLFMQWHDNSEDIKSMIFIASQDGSRFYGQDIVDFSNWGNNRSWSARIPTVLDVNGDGNDDLLMIWNDDTEDVKSMIWIASEDGSRFYGQDIVDFSNWGNNRSWSARIPTVLDVNGDGRDDLFMQWHDNSEDIKSMIFIASQDGSRFYGQDIVDFSNWGNNRSWSARIPTVLDVNGDGNDDLLMMWHNDNEDVESMIWIASQVGTRFFGYDNVDFYNWGNNTAWSSRTPIILDINGDDKDEIFLQWNE